LSITTSLENMSCARFPTSSLAALAGLRRLEGISVLPSGDDSWVFWSEDPDQRILRTLVPIEGVEFFEHRGGTWHQLGRRMPCFEVPGLDPLKMAIDRAIFPEPFEVTKPAELSTIPAKLRLVREGQQRLATAALCSLSGLGRWADSAPSSEIEAVRGAIQGHRALLLGRGLPAWSGSIRYWGDRVLVPIGFEVRPNLPEEAILQALGGSGLELIRFVEPDDPANGTSVELIPFHSFRPLTRASVRLALRARPS
jgi:hypothetical protein